MSCCKIESSYYQLSFSEMTNSDISLSAKISTDFGSSVLYLKEDVQLKINIESTFFKQEDYRRTVTEIDEKEYISLKIIVSELRNQYVCCGLHYLSASIYTCLCSESRITDIFACFQVTLHDMILKNIEKIKRPRSSNADALY